MGFHILSNWVKEVKGEWVYVARVLRCFLDGSLLGPGPWNSSKKLHAGATAYSCVNASLEYFSSWSWSFDISNDGFFVLTVFLILALLFHFRTWLHPLRSNFGNTQVYQVVWLNDKGSGGKFEVTVGWDARNSGTLPACLGEVSNCNLRNDTQKQFYIALP